MRDEREAPMEAAARLVGRMMLLPVTVFVYSLEGVFQALRQLPGVAPGSGPAVPDSGAGWSPAPPPAAPAPPAAPTGAPAPAFDHPGPRDSAGRPDLSRGNAMSDTSLSDDMVKLVRFTIVIIKRDAERVIHKGEQIVTDNLSDDAFASWMIASYLQSEEYRRSGHEIRHADKQYLRVCYEVLCRWPKQDRKYEKRQLEVLGEIRDAIEELKGAPARP